MTEPLQEHQLRAYNPHSWKLLTEQSKPIDDLIRMRVWVRVNGSMVFDQVRAAVFYSTVSRLTRSKQLVDEDQLRELPQWLGRGWLRNRELNRVSSNSAWHRWWEAFQDFSQVRAVLQHR